MKMHIKLKRFLAFLLILGLILSGHLLIWADVPVNQAAEEQTADIRNPITGSDGVTIWDCIQFGSYWQNDTNADGKADRNDDKEPIRWRVLSIKGNDAFLISDKNLDMKQYNDTYKEVTWKTCSLRTWLNKDFLNDAFNSSERAAIQQTTVVNEDNTGYGTSGGNDTKDGIYLLSLSEVENAEYGFSSSPSGTDSRKALNTAFATAQGAYEASSGNGYWRLRSPGDTSSRAAYVSYDGSVSKNGNSVNDNTRGVRPVLHLDLSVAAGWTYVGTVNSKNLYQEAPSHTIPDTTAAPTPGQPGGTTAPSVPDQPGGITAPSVPDQPGETAVPPSTVPKPEPSSAVSVPNQPGTVGNGSLAPGQENPAPVRPAVGSTASISGVQYKIVKSSETESTVVAVKAANKKVKSVNIPASVKIQNVSFKVTEISKNAFKGCKNLTKATIGSKVTIIGNGAFSGCKKIKTITIRSKVLKKIGKGAFAGISRKAKIKVPQSRVSQYRKLMKKG